MYFSSAPANLNDFERQALEALCRLLDALRPRHLVPAQTLAQREDGMLYLEMPHSSLGYRVTLMVEPARELTVYFDPPGADPPFDVGVCGDLDGALDLTSALLEGRAILESRYGGEYERIVVVNGDTRELVYWRASPASLIRERLSRARKWHQEQLPSFT